MATTLEEFSAKLDRLDAEFAKKMEEQNKKFFADKPDESTLSPEMKEHYEKFEKMIQEHTDKFNKKMHEHSEHFKAKFSELLEQQKNAQFPGKEGVQPRHHSMLRQTRFFFFRMKNGEMLVDYKILSRDHKRSLRVEEAVVDPRLARTVVPLSWLEQLRSPSVRLRTGYHTEEAVFVPPAYGSGDAPKGEKAAAAVTATPNAVMAGPVVVYVTGQNVPIVLNPYFVPDETWGLQKKGELDLRLGMDAIEQCTLFCELRPGGLLYRKLEENQNVKRYEPVRETLRRYGMKCELSESPLVPRPWTKMRYMFIDELQRGPKMTEFVGHNPRNGSPWRFSQHTKYFRLGVWRETIRRNDMNEGLHSHSSWQKSPQQSVPEVSFLAPYP